MPCTKISLAAILTITENVLFSSTASPASPFPVPEQEEQTVEHVWGVVAMVTRKTWFISPLMLVTQISAQQLKIIISMTQFLAQLC